MKKTNLLVAASVLGLSVLGYSANVFAADYDGATKATTEGAITITPADPDQPEIVDPEEPEKPIDPPNPNPNQGKLKINFVANFDFGEIENTSFAINQNAHLTEVTSNGVPEKRVPFLSVEDRRGVDRQGWQLRATQTSSFQDEDGNELTGAEISIQNLRYGSGNLANAPEIPNERIVLNNTEQVITQADASQGIGSWSMAFGERQADDTTNGISLSIPANTLKTDKTYTTSIVWELVAEPVAP
ncbi:hypothetical protein D920_00850 [Enterococcus faecalis 13-SD-W-01]|nr:hypothetical protein D920_00850 [Enterococcus faecalis 13-SD-W-01]